ncbi:MAG TPA: Uma2 family endonuclease [Acidimicrobiales bacterium]|nr:Uma2 family endonuclease [Acidimicrobiales bacterium]
MVNAGAHVGPWTVEDLLELPDSDKRYELLEGSLLVNPPSTPRHQRASSKLARILEDVGPEDLMIVEAVGVRLPEESMFIPDVLVVERQAALDNSSGILEPAVVRLVVEVVSPGSRTKDRLVKPALYARAGIPCFWRVEVDEGPSVAAHVLAGGTYREVASARPGALLTVDEPFAVSFDPVQLQP